MATYKVTADCTESIKQALGSYQDIYHDPSESGCLVQIYAGREEQTYILKVDGLEIYHIYNLVGWLAAPPGVPGVSDACAWCTVENEDGYLLPDPNNELGDTLLAVTASGKTYEVYQPDASISSSEVESLSYLAPAKEKGDAVSDVTLHLQKDGSMATSGGGCLGLLLILALGAWWLVQL